jgi:hypothetical protein
LKVRKLGRKERKRTEKAADAGVKRAFEAQSKLEGMAAKNHTQDYHECIGCVQ